MAQNYASRPVTRIASGSAAASALVQISGLKADSQKPGAPSVEDFDAIVSLPLQQLRIQLDAATSDELRGLRFHIGLGKAGTKEANKMLIYDHIAKNRSAAGFESSQFSDLDDDSFADGSHALPPAPALPSFSAIPGAIIPDPMQEDDPWRSSTSQLPPKKPLVSPLLSSPHRRLVNKVFTESAPPAVPEVHLYGGSTDPLDAPWSLVLSSLSDLSKFVKNEMVTRNHLDSYHRETIEMIEARVQETIAPLQES